MIDVGPINLWELFKTMCMGTAVAEFNDILFKASRKKSSSSKNISKRRSALQMDTPKKSRPEKYDKQKLERQCYPVTSDSYSFPPSGICPPPERAPVDKLVRWNASGIQSLDALVWLNLHKHGWEYSELLHDNIME